MLVSCISCGDQMADGSGVVVFPERVALSELLAAQSASPDSIIVGAVIEEGHCRGYLLHRGTNRIDYPKVRSDFYAEGSGFDGQSPLYECDDIAIGVLICRDIQHVELLLRVVNGLLSSPARLKLLCIPAAMDNHWFPGASLGSQYQGIHVALCNHPTAHDIRCQSFIANAHGERVRTQSALEPLHIELPLA